MFPRKSPNKKPIKLGPGSKKLNEMNAFIDTELKSLMNRRQQVTSLNNPININNSMAESQNNLKNVMNKNGFGAQNKPIEEQMRTSQSKFEGFSNVTKFTDNPNTSVLIDKKESRRARRPPSSSSNKSEPFIIKFPQEQTSKNKNKELLKHLNKDKEVEVNFKNNITGLKPENKIKDEQKNKKPYIESYNKIEGKPKNIFSDEEIEEDYGDFENVDENGKILYELNKGTGKVQEYNIYGFLIFEGEYLNGLRNGKGKEYDQKDCLIFEGEYLNGEKISAK